MAPQPKASSETELSVSTHCRRLDAYGCDWCFCARYAGLPRWGRVRKVDADAAEASLLLREYGKAGKPKRVKDIYANAVVAMKSGTTKSDATDKFALSNADMKAVTREVRTVDRHARFFFFLNGKSLIDDETNADLERAYASGQRGLIFNFASKLWRVDFDRMKMTNLLTGQSVIIEREASRPPALLKSAFPLEDSAYMEKHGLYVLIVRSFLVADNVN